jgi:hypothetical protein
MSVSHRVPMYPGSQVQKKDVPLFVHVPNAHGSGAQLFAAAAEISKNAATSSADNRIADRPLIPSRARS